MNATATIAVPALNLVLAWVWLLLGFLSGLALGLFFHRDDWLGGYGSFQRRLYRLAHISFFGLGFTNLGFYFTAQRLSIDSPPLLSTAAISFVVGALFMPLCCVLTAHCPRCRPLFAVPVLSLLLGAALTAVLLLRQAPTSILSQL